VAAFQALQLVHCRPLSIQHASTADRPPRLRQSQAKYQGAGPIRGDGGKCVDDADASTNNGTAIQIWTCNGTSAQRWGWSSGDGALRVLDKCMDVTGGVASNGTPIQLWACNGSGAGGNRAASQSGRCLDVTSGGTRDATRLQIWDCNDTAAQAWYLP
jgi:chitinase